MPSLLKQLLLLPTALLSLCLSQVSADVLEKRQDETTTLPAPIVFTPDQNWDGIDGTWSTFTLRVGTPQQFVRTFLSWTSYQTWVVLPEGCPNSNDTTCAETRGWLFNQSASTTFDEIGIYDLWIERNLGYGGNAIYGYDTVGLGGQGEGGPTLENTTVGGLAVTEYYLGVFGVNPKPTNFTTFNEPSPSYMTQLKEQKLIPSVSFGFTQGAPYRFTSTGVYASLTLGGYDTSKFIPNNITWTFAADNDRDVVVALQDIITPGSPADISLLPEPVYVYIDNTIPQIWLPVDACQAFEREFGLVWNETVDLYLVNDTTHASLLDRNPNVTFTLGTGFVGGQSVNITLPYAAFDLQAAQPYREFGAEQVNYFPLRRAANDSQYSLGRTFMQEAYITIDYEAQRFQLAQVAWDQNAQSNIVAIPPFNMSQPDTAWTSSTWNGGSSDASSTTSSSSSSSSIGGGAIAGIVIGAVAVIAALGGLLWWYLRRNKSKAKKVDDTSDSSENSADTGRGRHYTVEPKAELYGDSPLPPPGTDTDSKGLLSANGSTRAGTPRTPNAPSSLGYFGPNGSSAYSPTTPSAGEGTHSSTNTGTIFSPISPASEADSKERQIFEMAGDMPTIREKDGKLLSEKEALQHREKVYNGVDSQVHTPTSAVEEGIRDPNRVNPDDVVDANTGASLTRHRAFSFEQDNDSRELYDTTP